MSSRHHRLLPITALLLCAPLAASAQDDTIRIFEGADAASPQGSIKVDSGTPGPAADGPDELGGLEALLAEHGAPLDSGAPALSLDAPSCTLTMTSQPGMVGLSQASLPLRQVTAREGKASVKLADAQAPQSVAAVVIGCKKGACLSAPAEDGSDKQLATLTLALKPGAGAKEIGAIRKQLDAVRVSCDRKPAGGLVVESGGTLPEGANQPAAPVAPAKKAAPAQESAEEAPKKKPTPAEVEAELKKALGGQGVPSLDF